MRWLVLVCSLLAVHSFAIGAEVGLVTAMQGGVTLVDEKEASSDLRPFVKLRSGDRLTLKKDARLQLVYFEGGRQEVWQGVGVIAIGTAESVVAKGGLQPEVRQLPAVLVRQLTKTPAPDGSVKAGMVRMRSMPSGGTTESVERNYAELRSRSDVADRNPELYLLASYLELREFEKLDSVLQRLAEQSPKDPEIQVLTSLYRRAVNNLKMAEKN